jgi:hypothetical protein
MMKAREARREVYDDDGNIIETTMVPFWLAFAESPSEIIIELPEESEGRNVQLSISPKAILEELKEKEGLNA